MTNLLDDSNSCGENSDENKASNAPIMSLGGTG
jgi:hypothetical protein